MMLDQDELDAIFEGRWVIDCPVMRLSAAHGEGGILEGAGYIEQAEGYQLRFKLISAQQARYPFRPEPTQAGQLYAPEEYWKLTAKDIRGRDWTADRILPAVLHDEGMVATGALRDLTSTTPESNAEDRHTIKLWFLGDFEVTCNQIERVTTEVEGEEPRLSGQWNQGKFALGQRELLFKKDKEWLFLEIIDSARSFQPFYTDRIEESLEFVMGRPTEACVLLRNELLCTLQIRSVPPAPHDDKAKPPYPPPPKDRNRYFWHLFGLYLKYVETHSGPSRPALSRAWKYFTDSRGAALEIRALALGVGIEALLQVTRPVKERASDPQLDAARNFVKAAAELCENVRKRLLGCLASMAQLSPSDRLHNLMERGVISKDQLKAWKDIRNRATHAEEFSLDDETLRDCNRVLTAAYRIVFDMLGYEGAYRDYGTFRWPMMNYPESVGTP
jgi:hypothetical protein